MRPPRAYYNDSDPFVAAWLRRLIKAGEIMEGDVDDRSIRSVRPADVRGYSHVHLFAGIGGWAEALRLARWPGERPVWTASCPCQPFSPAGRQRGSEDRRHLWPYVRELVAECSPASLFGEQVVSPLGREWFSVVRSQMEDLAYAVGAADLCAPGVGAPHIRQRNFFAAFPARALADNDLDGFAARHRDERGPPRARGEDRDDADRRGGAGVLADADRGSLSQPLGRAPGRNGHPAISARGDAALVLADANGSGPARVGRRREGVRSPEYSEALGMADAPSARRGGTEDAGAGLSSEGQIAAPHAGRRAGLIQSERASRRPRALGFAAGPGLQGVEDRGGDLQRQAWQAIERAGSNAPNPWADAVWLLCRDGKARPTQSGLFPLAYGIPARMGRLRAYGNAIIPWLAALFVEEMMAIVG